MIRIRKLQLTGFRGALEPVEIDLKSQCKSLAIYGANGTGKSTITDALEWFYYDRVDHLWRENCKENALPNTMLPVGQDTCVEVTFNDDTLSGKKTLSSNASVSTSNASQAFKKHIESVKSGQERVVLRHADLLRFLVSTKGQKREELARIIGYQELESFRDVVRHSQTKLENDHGGTPDRSHCPRRASSSVRASEAPARLSSGVARQ